MIWLEIINVRTAGYEDTLAALDLCRRIRPHCSNVMPIELRVYKSAGCETDLSVHIRWNLEGKQPGKSPLGLEVGSAFSDLGFVNHTIWSEVVSEGDATGIRPDSPMQSKGSIRS